MKTILKPRHSVPIILIIRSNMSCINVLTCIHKLSMNRKYGVHPQNDENIGFDRYIGTWILRIYWIYRRYIGGYFYMNIDISEINKNTLKFMKTLSKSVKMTLIIKYIH